MMYGHPAAGDQLLAFQLGLTIDVERPGRIVLLIGLGRGLVAVENVIGGVVDEQAAVACQLLCHARGSQGIDGPRHFRLALGLVHRRIGGSVYEDVRFELAHCPRHGVEIGQVQLIAREGRHVAQWRQSALQMPAYLAGRTGDEQSQAHGWYRGNWSCAICESGR